MRTLSSRLNLNLYTKDDIKYISENIERRNLLVHNRGRIDKKFAVKIEGITGNPIDVGLTLRVAGDAVDELTRKLSKLARDFDDGIAGKYPLVLNEIDLEQVENKYQDTIAEAASYMEIIRKNIAPI